MFNTNKRFILVLITVISCLLYYFTAYHLERTSFNTLILIWTVLFGGYAILLRNNYSFKHLAAIAVLFRLLFLIAIPNLSQDFYRFIWDGRMILEGMNPYIFLPENFIKSGFLPVEQAKELYEGMGPMNGSHYTNYPPLNQLSFLIAALFSSKSILGAAIAMRIQIILADIGIIYVGAKLLRRLGKNPSNIFLYALNPFIIIELTGNLHFEPVMLFFLVLSLYLFHKKKWILSAFMLAFSVSVKLIPLFFLPIFLRRFLIKNGKLELEGNAVKLLLFYSIVIATTIVLFLPFLSEFLIQSYSNSVGLWFRSFEFNASFYYVFREVGYLFRGYNEIAVIGKILPTLSVLFLLGVSLFRKNTSTIDIITSMLLALSFYYFMSTTVHPWYLATLIILSVFTKYKYPLVWSFVIILSYQAYANTPWHENLWFVALEYVVVFGYLIYELKKPTQRLSGKNCYEKEKESGL
ncbi:mannosyltransferase [Tenacibaculum sp. 190524A05c]|uniref:mannosyltransferase n=1 Tax=Tenacibaculum platacis TaxID=3137852 RepID=UPI0032B28C3F